MLNKLSIRNILQLTGQFVRPKFDSEQLTLPGFFYVQNQESNMSKCKGKRKK